MKNVLNYISYAPRKVFASFAVLLIAMLPLVSTFAAEDVLIEGSLGVANQTAGETRWEEATNASFDDEVIFQIYYHNRELCDSGRVAENLAVDVNMGEKGSETAEIVGVNIKGDNTNEIRDIVTVNFDRADARLEFMPGTVVWKHNNATDGTENIVTTQLPDSVVTGNGFQVIENVQPCAKYDATITFKARVVVSSVLVDKYVRVAGTDTWARTNTAKPGDTLEYAIGYKNNGNTQHDNVVIRDSLPPTLDYVEGSTQLKNAKNGGVYKSVASNNVVEGGINIGSYTAGSNAYVKFRAVVPTAENLACGVTEFRNVGVAQPEGMNEFYNTAITTVEKVCDEPEVEVCNPETGDIITVKESEASNYESVDSDKCQEVQVCNPETGEIITVTKDKEGDYEAVDSDSCKDDEIEPTYACEMLTREKVSKYVYKFTAKANADNGATVKSYAFNFGDGSDKAVTTESSVEHTYLKDGEYTVSVEVMFDVDGETVTETADDCKVKVVIDTPETPETPTELPETGPAEAVMAFFGTGALGQGIRVWLASRKRLIGSLLG